MALTGSAALVDRSVEDVAGVVCTFVVDVVFDGATILSATKKINGDVRTA